MDIGHHRASTNGPVGSGGHYWLPPPPTTMSAGSLRQTGYAGVGCRSDSPSGSPSQPRSGAPGRRQTASSSPLAERRPQPPLGPPERVSCCSGSTVVGRHLANGMVSTTRVCGGGDSSSTVGRDGRTLAPPPPPPSRQTDGQRRDGATSMQFQIRGAAATSWAVDDSRLQVSGGKTSSTTAMRNGELHRRQTVGAPEYRRFDRYPTSGSDGPLPPAADSWQLNQWTGSVSRQPQKHPAAMNEVMVPSSSTLSAHGRRCNQLDAVDGRLLPDPDVRSNARVPSMVAGPSRYHNDEQGQPGQPPFANHVAYNRQSWTPTTSGQADVRPANREPPKNDRPALVAYVPELPPPPLPPKGLRDSDAATNHIPSRTVLVRRGSTSDDSGFHEQWVPVGWHGQTDRDPHQPDRVRRGPASGCLDAHELVLASGSAAGHASTSAATGQSTSSSSPRSSKKADSTPNVIRRHLRTIAEGFDHLRASTTTSGLTKSTSEPEALDRLGEQPEKASSEGGHRLRALVVQEQELLRRHNREAPSDDGRRAPEVVDDDVSVDDERTVGALHRQSKSTPSLRLWRKSATTSSAGAKSVPASPTQKSDTSAHSAVAGGWPDHPGLVQTVRRRCPAPTNLLQLTEDERLALQKLALSKLQAIDLGCTIAIPKSWRDGAAAAGGRTGTGARAMRKLIQLKKYVSSANTGDAFAANKDGQTAATSGSGGGKSWVFGIALKKCIANEAELSSRPVTPSGEHNLLDALSLSYIGDCDKTGSLEPVRHVPYIVNACCRHLRAYGLNVAGLFRIAGSKARIASLRQEFDSGHFVRLTSEHGVHDVASLLKEFLRDLRDPLLTHALYPAFLAAAAIGDVNRRVSILRLLVALLPQANRDTLWTLMTFLSLVARHASDSLGDDGHVVDGNKMDSSNLATVIGPNILHRVKSGKSQIDILEEVSQNADAVSITKDLIDFHAAIFSVKSDLYDEVVNEAVDSKNVTVGDVVFDRAGVGRRSADDHAYSTLYVDTTDGSEGSFRTSSSGCDQNSPPLGTDRSEQMNGVKASASYLKPPIDNHTQQSYQLNSRHSNTETPIKPVYPAEMDHLRPSESQESDVGPGTVGDWQWQRWRHWEEQARMHSSETQEQQTLV